MLEFNKKIEVVPDISYYLQCIAISGTDESLTFSWAKDGYRLLPNDNLKIESTGPLSVLHIFKLKPFDSGLYECSVNNANGQKDSTSTQLRVKGLSIFSNSDNMCRS